MEDAESLASAESGHRLEALYRRFRPALLSFFLRRHPSYAEAEDMVQDVLVRLAADPELSMRSAEAYLFQMATNILRDRARRQTVRDNHRRGEEGLALRDLDPLHAERVLIAKQGVRKLAQLLDSLPERTRDIFILFRLEAMPRKDIAETFGISISAVDKHIAKVMSVLMREWRDEE